MASGSDIIKMNGKDRNLIYFQDFNQKAIYWADPIEFGGDTRKYHKDNLNFERFISSIETDTLSHSGQIDSEYGEIGFNDSMLIGEAAARQASKKKSSSIWVVISQMYDKVGLELLPENFENRTNDEMAGYTSNLLNRIVKEVENPENFI